METKMKNVLVFPCGSEIALEIYRAVNKSTFFHLIGASSVDDHGKFVYEDYIDGIPFIDSDDFIPAIKKIVRERKIDFVYPAMDAVITKLKENEAEIGCKVVAAPVETTEICLSKKKTYEVLKDSVKVPKTFRVDDVDVFPVFCKPEVGYGARGARVVNSAEQLDEWMSEHISNAIISEYLPGEEYTVDCFTGMNRELKACKPRVRARVQNGISVNTKPVVDNGEFADMGRKINEKIEFLGAWFFQVKRDVNGVLTLLEVACRFGGSSSLFRAKGINFPLSSLFVISGVDVDFLENNYDVEMDRALDNRYKIGIDFQNVYMDYDDSIILEKKFYNESMMKFIFWCKNRGKKIILLSSHDGDLDERLNYFKIRELFDEVIHITKEDEKYNYIQDNSIFIDDSFKERKKVFEKKKIPVFSIDMVECLM